MDKDTMIYIVSTDKDLLQLVTPKVESSSSVAEQVVFCDENGAGLMMNC